LSHLPTMTSRDIALPGRVVRGAPAAFFNDLLALTKPRITASMLITALAAYLLAADGAVQTKVMVGMLTGVGLVISGASAMNQWLERETDKLFRRTCDRPLPAGRLSPKIALIVAFSTAPLGTWLLLTHAGVLPASLGLFAFFVYWAIYTPLKRSTPWSWLPGAVAGATPPLIGWTAAYGDLSPTAWVLFAILFIWQLPHTIGLQWWQLDDYQRAHFPLLLNEDANGAARLAFVVFPALTLIPVSLLLANATIPGLLYAFVCISLGIILLRSAFRFSRAPAPDSARRLFFSSLSFLSALFITLTVFALF
jgi:protoheme IX farnesyltransferase